MAGDSSPPRIVRSLTGGAGGKVFHAKHFNGETVPGGGGGGLERGFTGGGGSGFGSTGATRDSGDPAVTGNFDYNRVNTFLGFPIAGGGLTERGKRDQADSDILKKGQLAYADAINGGATQTEAFTAAVRAGGGAPYLSALMSHPSSPLASLPTAHAFLSGGEQPQPEKWAPGNNGQQFQIDPQSGKVIGSAPIPGYDKGQPAFDKNRMVKTNNGLGYAQDDGTVRPMTWSNGAPIPGGGGVIAPTGGPTGQVGLPPTGKAGAPAANPQLTMYSKDPIPSADAKHPLTNAQVNYLSNAPNFIKDLKVLRDYAAGTSGPISGSVNYVGGKYLGLNAEAAEAAAALNRLDQGVYAQYGVKGSAGAKQLMATLPTHNQAPSYVQKAVTGMIENATTELQNTADLTEKQSGPLPRTVTSQLAAKADVYTLSNQNNASPTWIARNYPDQLDETNGGPTLAHRTDLEPSEVQGLNKKLDTVAARRAQDTQTAAQNSAAQANEVRNRPSSIPPTPTAPATPAGAAASEGTSGTGQPPAGSSATPGAPQGPQQTPQDQKQGNGTGTTTLPDVNVTGSGSGEVVPGVTVAPGSPFAAAPGAAGAAMPNSSTTPAATPAPPAAAPASPVAPQTEATPPAQPAVNPYAAAAIDALGQGT